MWVIDLVVTFCYLCLCVHFDLHSVAQIICVDSGDMSVTNTKPENLTSVDYDCFCVYVCLQLLKASVWGKRKAEAKVCIKCCLG
jgi:hypothetical protein